MVEGFESLAVVVSFRLGKVEMPWQVANATPHDHRKVTIGEQVCIATMREDTSTMAHYWPS